MSQFEEDGQRFLDEHIFSMIEAEVLNRKMAAAKAEKERQDALLRRPRRRFARWLRRLADKLER